MTRPPNILLVMADQLTAGALPAYGNTVAKTPHIDALGARRTVFANNYCNFPICAPSRASMLTGRYATEVGAFDNGADFPSSTPTLMHHLRLRGYRTILAGKMHFVGPDQLHGFDERLTTDIYPSDFSWTPNWSLPGPPESAARMSLRGVVESGLCVRSMQLDYDGEVAFHAERRLYDLARDPDRPPFFMTVSFTHPHNPFVTTREYWDRYERAEIDMLALGPIPFQQQDGRSQRHHLLTRVDEYDVTPERLYVAGHAYYAMTSYIDDKLGALVAALESSGLAEDTVVIFTADHGEMLGERGMWFKMCMFEGAVRVPLLMAGGAVPAGQRVARSTSLLDLAPTILGLAASITPATNFTGHDLAPKHATEVDEMIAAMRPHWDLPALNRAVRDSPRRRHLLRAALAVGEPPL